MRKKFRSRIRVAIEDPFPKKNYFKEIYEVNRDQFRILDLYNMF